MSDQLSALPVSQPYITLSEVAFSWPDGSPVFDGVNVSFSAASYSLVGANGAGKSTLLALIAGHRQPTRGSVTTTGEAALVPQDPLSSSNPAATIADTLGITEVLAALRHIEAGSVDPDDFDAVGDEWDIEAQATAVLAQLGLPTDIERTVATLSGGEATLLAIAARLLTRPAILLLDEPTNNLDIAARGRLFEAIDAFSGTVVVVSHDLELLGRVDATVELYRGQLRTFGGPYEVYREAIDTEQRAAEAAATTAANTLAAQRRDQIRAQQTLASRTRMANKAEREKRVPKIIAHARRDAAQVSAGKLRAEHRDGVEVAQRRLDDARSDIRDQRDARIDMPDVALASTAQVVVDDRLHLVGPERVAITGPNGTGKTTLIRSLIDDEHIAVPYAYVPQRINLGDPDRRLVDAVRASRPGIDEQPVRAHLARFLFRGVRAERRVGDLSGGEQVRAALAVALLGGAAPDSAAPDSGGTTGESTPMPRLLILDEPTNNLDTDTVEQLVGALAQWRGALILVSHDVGFRERVGVDRQLALQR